MLIADADTFHTTGFLSVSTAGCGLCVVHYILHTYRYEKVEFFFNFTPRMFTYCTILWADGGTGQILISGQSGLCYGDNSDRVTFYRTSSAETKLFQKGFLVLHLEKTEFLLRVLAFFPMMQLYYSFWYFRILHFV